MVLGVQIKALVTVSKSLFLCIVKLKKLDSISSKIGLYMSHTVHGGSLSSFSVVLVQTSQHDPLN